MNVWCATISSTDVNFHGLKAGYSSSLDSINNYYRETFVNTEIPSHKIMPVVEMPESIYKDNGFQSWIRKWHIDNQVRGGGGGVRRLVFVFNFTPLSATKNPYCMNHYIVWLAQMFPNTHMFMVPSHTCEFDAYPNIICCDRLFGYSESEKSFRNLFILEPIVRECDIIISQYCGASWIWFNEHLAQYYRNKSIYITHPSMPPDADYAFKMNEWFRIFMGDNTGVEYIKFVPLASLPYVMESRSGRER